MSNFSAIIITRNRDVAFQKSYSSLLELQKRYPILSEIIVIDNASDAVVVPLPHSPTLTVLRNQRPEGISVNRNLGIRVASTDFYVFLDDDAFVKDLDLSMVDTYLRENPRVALLAPKIYYPDGRLQESVRAFPTLFALFWRGFRLYTLAIPKWYKKYVDPIPQRDQLTTPVPIDWAIGACMILRAEALLEIGTFDDKYLFGYEDADIAKRLHKKGYSVMYWPHARIVHTYARESANLFSKAAVRHIYSIGRFFVKSFS